ncbi:MAG: TRAP transporter small permease [Chloroflexota bacterium]
MKWLRKLGVFFDHTVNLMALVAGILLTVALLGVSLGVFSRYFLNRPIGWVSEVAGYTLLYIAFLTAAWILRDERHVKMDLIIERVSPRVRFILNMMTSSVCVLVCLVLTWYGLKVTVNLYETHYFTPTFLQLPKAILTAIIFLGSFLLTIQFLRRIYNYLAAWRVSQDK